MRISGAFGVVVAILGAQGPAQAQTNLIVNGGFEAGNTGFVSDYGYTDGGNCCEGQYTVRGNGSTFNGGFVDPPPSSAGSVLMMVVNGSTAPGPRIWAQTIPVQPGRSYRLSLRGCTAVAGGPAILQWQVDGVLIGQPVTLPAVTQVWVTVESLYVHNSAAGTIGLALRDLNTATFPNDFYIDDLSMSPACPADIGSTGGTPGPDGALDNNDFVVFIDYFFAHDTRADVGSTGGVPGSDGAFDNNDFVVFIDLFFGGCP